MLLSRRLQHGNLRDMTLALGEVQGSAAGAGLCLRVGSERGQDADGGQVVEQGGQVQQGAAAV